MSSMISEVLELAADQAGLLTTQQAARRGISRLVLSRLAERGALERISHGVYSTPEGTTGQHVELRAAWLALDPDRYAHERLDAGPAGFTVTHRSAAELHGLGQLIPDKLEFVSTVRKRTRREDLRLRRRAIDAADITVVDGIPVTTVERTIADLVDAREDLSHVADVLGDAELSVIDFERLKQLLEPLAHRNGYESGADFLRFFTSESRIDGRILSSIITKELQPLMDSIRPQLPTLTLKVEASTAAKTMLETMVKENMSELRETFLRANQ